MDYQHWDLVAIVGLEAHKPSGIRVFSRPDHANEAESLRPVLCQQSGGSNRKIGCEGVVAPRNRDSVGRERILHSYPPLPTPKFQYRNQAVEKLLRDYESLSVIFSKTISRSQHTASHPASAH